MPVSVPWVDGLPTFSAMSLPRAVIIATHRLCAICGLALDASELYWRNGDGDFADMHETLLTAGVAVFGTSSNELGGHRECVTYAAMACPYLATDGARTVEAVSVGTTRPVGELRGVEATICAHDTYTYEMSPDFIGAHFGQLIRQIRYREGSELAGDLAEAIRIAPARAARPGAPRLWDRDLSEDAIEGLAVAIAEGRK